MKKIVLRTAITLALLLNLSGCSEDENTESAEVKKAKEIMAKNIIKEEEKKQKQKELRKNGQGDFSNAK